MRAKCYRSLKIKSESPFEVLESQQSAVARGSEEGKRMLTSQLEEIRQIQRACANRVAVSCQHLRANNLASKEFSLHLF